MATDVRTTACPLDCPDTCSLSVTLRDGVIEAVDAGPGNPLTDGWICAKVKHHARRVYAPERVRTPLVRTGPKGSGSFRPASWDEALALIAAQLRTALDEVGPDAVVPYTYNSSASAHEADGVTEALFAALGATEVRHTICAATTSASWASVFGSMLSADPLDVVHSQLVVVWGANPTVSNTHFPPLVRQAVRTGARVVVVDPRRTAMASRADLHLALRPGTDVVLALAVARELAANGWVDRAFCAAHADGVDELLAAADPWTPEVAAAECGLDAEAIRTFAAWFGTTRPTMLRMGWGQERNANGGAACRAILSLPVLAGHAGVPGAGVIGATGSAGAVRTRRRWPTIERRARRALPMHEIGRWLAADAGDPCRVLLVQGANPAVTAPDQHAVLAALSRDDVFTVVHDQVLTDTARFADVVLPATTHFELDGVATSYGSYTVQPVRAVIDRVGESRSNDEVGLALARALGFDWDAPTAPSTDDPGPRTVRERTLQFVDTLPHDGRARLVDPVAGPPVYRPIESRWPLTLVSPASAKLINSMFGEFQSPEPTVTLHPADASARGLVDGELVVVCNDAGQLRLRLVVSDEVRPGVAATPKGVWLRTYPDGIGVNVLTPASADTLAGGACFNDTRVDVLPATTAAPATAAPATTATTAAPATTVPAPS